MVIYYLFINGKYRFKTNSFEEIIESINDVFPLELHMDYVIEGLISKHEFHYFDFEGNRKIDIVASIVG